MTNDEVRVTSVVSAFTVSTCGSVMPSDCDFVRLLENALAKVFLKNFLNRSKVRRSLANN
jgi:hypothetical protein